jgi:16S rRNA (guanine966-N2)-methyltransferase
MIDSPSGERTRPTQARTRQALFNSVQAHAPGANVLDLFAGSGLLGFEALSRGAARATLVESARAAVKCIAKNARTLGVEDRVTIVGEPLERSIERIGALAPFDLVLADPPYAAGWELRLLDELPWGEWLAPDGLLCLEWGRVKSKVDALPDATPFLVKAREKIYGESVLTTYTRAGVTPPNSPESPDLGS